MTFAKALREAREKAGMTQIELSKALRVSFSTVNRYENERHFPTPIVLEAIKSYFASQSIVFKYDEPVEVCDGNKAKEV